MSAEEGEGGLEIDLGTIPIYIHSDIKPLAGQAWCYVRVITTFTGLQQEDGEFQASLGYILRTMLRNNSTLEALSLVVLRINIPQSLEICKVMLNTTCNQKQNKVNTNYNHDLFSLTLGIVVNNTEVITFKIFPDSCSEGILESKICL